MTQEIKDHIIVTRSMGKSKPIRPFLDIKDEVRKKCKKLNEMKYGCGGTLTQEIRDTLKVEVRILSMKYVLIAGCSEECTYCQHKPDECDCNDEVQGAIDWISEWADLDSNKIMEDLFKENF